MEISDGAMKLRTTLDATIGFELPTKTKQKFQSISAHFNAQPPLPQLLRLKPVSESNKNWWHIFAESVLHSVQEGLAATYYHQKRVEILEQKIIKIAVAAIPELQLPKKSVLAPGSERQLNFEYQAYLFAIRRTLEYFAVSVGAFFKCDAHRIRTITETIRGREPAENCEKVRKKITIALRNLTDILPPDKKIKGSRDILAHYKSVSAGTLNIANRESGYEIRLWGGGERLEAWSTETPPQVAQRIENGIAFEILNPTLLNQIAKVEQLIFDFYQTIGICD